MNVVFVFVDGICEWHRVYFPGFRKSSLVFGRKKNAFKSRKTRNLWNVALSTGFHSRNDQKMINISQFWVSNGHLSFEPVCVVFNGRLTCRCRDRSICLKSISLSVVSDAGSKVRVVSWDLRVYSYSVSLKVYCFTCQEYINHWRIESSFGYLNKLIS